MHFFLALSQLYLLSYLSSPVTHIAKSAKKNKKWSYYREKGHNVSWLLKDIMRGGQTSLPCRVLVGLADGMAALSSFSGLHSRAIMSQWVL